MAVLLTVVQHIDESGFRPGCDKTDAMFSHGWLFLTESQFNLNLTLHPTYHNITLGPEGSVRLKMSKVLKRIPLWS